MFRRFEPDLLTWQKRGDGAYERHDGLARVEHRGNRWVPMTRPTIDHAWTQSRYFYGALHAAQDHCRRTQTS